MLFALYKLLTNSSKQFLLLKNIVYPEEENKHYKDSAANERKTQICSGWDVCIMVFSLPNIRGIPLLFPFFGKGNLPPSSQPSKPPRFKPSTARPSPHYPLGVGGFSLFAGSVLPALAGNKTLVLANLL